MEEQITNFVKNSIIFLKGHSNKEYLQKFAFDKIKTDIFLEKGNIKSFNYSFLEHQRNDFYATFKDQIKNSQFSLKDIEIEKITLKEHIINDYKGHRAIVLVSAGLQKAIFEINCITIFDDGTILSDGELNLKVFQTKKRKKKHIKKSFNNLFATLKILEKTVNEYGIESNPKKLHEKASIQDISESESRLGVKFPEELIKYWHNFTNGNGKSSYKHTNYFGLEFFSHQKVVGIADFFQLSWAILLEDEINIFEVEDETPLTQEEKDIVLKVNKDFFVFAVEWPAEAQFLDFLVFDHNYNTYLISIDMDLSAFSHLKAIKSNTILKENDFNRFINKYVNSQLARYQT